MLAAIREHAHAQPEGWESVGRLVARGDLAVDYWPLPNRAKRPGAFRLASAWRRVPGERSIIVHSHPAPGSARPSPGDLARAREGWLAEYGIYSLADDELALYRIAPDRASFARLPLLVEPRRSRLAR